MKNKLSILIVDDDQRMTSTLADILTVAGYTTDQASSASMALEKVNQKDFDCILTDFRMPEMDGVAFHKFLHKEKPGLPVVLMTAFAADEIIQRGLDEGVVGVLNKPLDITQMLGFFAALSKQQMIAIVDNDPGFCKTLGDILNKRGFFTEVETDPHANMKPLMSDAQVLLLDMKLNSISGLDLLKTVKKYHPELPVLLITGYRAEMEESIRIAMENSAFTCLYKPLEIKELLRLLEDFQLKRLRSAITESQLKRR
jgi:two-component system, NtrC family, response regulator HydG